MKGQIALSRRRIAKNLSHNAICQLRINSIIAIIGRIHIFIIIVDVKYPKAGGDFVTQNLRPAAKIFTGGQFFSWVQD